MRLSSKYLLHLFVLAATVFSGCSKDSVDFDNKTYITSLQVFDDLYLRADEPAERQRIILVRSAVPVENDVTITFGITPEAIDKYKVLYNDSKILPLPVGHCELVNATSTIKAGGVSGADIVVKFSDLHNAALDPKKRYLLPVSIVSSEGVPHLESTETTYFILRGAAIINYVADLTSCRSKITWKGSAPKELANLDAFTIEFIVRNDASKWKGIRTILASDATVIRTADFITVTGGSGSQFPDGLIQMRYKQESDKWPDVVLDESIRAMAPERLEPDGNKDIMPTGEFVHVAIVYYNDGSRKLYYNGEVVYETAPGEYQSEKITGPYNLYNKFDLAGAAAGEAQWWVGYDFEPERNLPGKVSELRIWKTARSAEEINGNNKENMIRIKNPEKESDLVLYLKYNDARGGIIKDHSKNKSHVISCNLYGESPVDPLWTSTWIDFTSDFDKAYNY